MQFCWRGSDAPPTSSQSTMPPTFARFPVNVQFRSAGDELRQKTAPPFFATLPANTQLARVGEPSAQYMPPPVCSSKFDRMRQPDIRIDEPTQRTPPMPFFEMVQLVTVGEACQQERPMYGLAASTQSSMVASSPGARNTPPRSPAVTVTRERTASFRSPRTEPRRMVDSFLPPTRLAWWQADEGR